MLHRLRIGPTVAIILFTLSMPAAQSPRELEVRRFVDLQSRLAAGERLSPEDDEYRTKYAAARQERWKAFRAARQAVDRTGLIPLTELGRAHYKGQEGGLYANGEKTPPAAHLQAGLQAARGIRPLDGEGRAAPDGRIPLLAVGMSNTTMEFSAFMRLAAADRSLNPRLELVDGAQAGQTAESTSNPAAHFWKVLDGRLSAAGITARQVQVAWVKLTLQEPDRTFPAEAKALQARLGETLRILHERFPNLKIAYLSSRIYAGYATVRLSPEPFTYEDGFAVKWLVADQIGGAADLNHDAARGPVRSPWLTWGPYLWADGANARLDGLSYSKEDFAGDGVHPSEKGCEKIARLLLEFFKKDPTARLWFLADAASPAQRSAAKP